MPLGNREPKYRRILLKFSGEALIGKVNYGIDPKVVQQIAQELRELHSIVVEVGLVVEVGNIFRGAGLAAAGMVLVTADHRVLLATVMNALALQDDLERLGVF